MFEPSKKWIIEPTSNRRRNRKFVELGHKITLKRRRNHIDRRDRSYFDTAFLTGGELAFRPVGEVQLSKPKLFAKTNSLLMINEIAVEGNRWKKGIYW